MSNRTYICVKCRFSRRARVAGWLLTSYRCPGCGGALWELSHRWRIPRKDDGKGWEELGGLIREEEPVRESYRHRRGSELLAAVDKKIETAEKCRPSEAKEKRLKRLKEERDGVVSRFFDRRGGG